MYNAQGVIKPAQTPSLAMTGCRDSNIYRKNVDASSRMLLTVYLDVERLLPKSIKTFRTAFSFSAPSDDAAVSECRPTSCAAEIGVEPRLSYADD